MHSEEIMRTVRRALDGLNIAARASRSEWTAAVAAKLCRVGRQCDCWVYASSVPDRRRDGHGWLYDVTWLSYQPDGEKYLLDAELVAECEWNSGLDYIDEDFQKLLLARATVRLMIFDGGDAAGANRIAKHLAQQVAAFRRSSKNDAWLLAAWTWDDMDERGWSFHWFTIKQGEAAIHTGDA